MENIAVKLEQNDYEQELIQMLERREKEIEKAPEAKRNFFEAIEDIQKSL